MDLVPTDTPVEMASPAAKSRAFWRLKWAALPVAALILALALAILAHTLNGISWAELYTAFYSMSERSLLLCVGLTCISFATLGLYDLVAVNWIGSLGISLRRAWFAGVTATAISNTLGFHGVTAVAVRYRVFSRSAFAAAAAAKVTALSSTTLVLGFASVLSAAMIASPSTGKWQHLVGVSIALSLLAGISLLKGGRRITLKGYTITLPPAGVALLQTVLGALEMASAIGALYVLFPETATPSFAAFCAIYIGAVLLGILSHAPGGLGVFEAAMLAGTGQHSRAGILAALLIYRLLYNLCPFLIAAVALASDELWAAANLKADKP